MIKKELKLEIRLKHFPHEFREILRKVGGFDSKVAELDNFINAMHCEEHMPWPTTFSIKGKA